VRFRILIPALGLASLIACSTEWPMYRHNVLRSGGQINSSDLSNPAKVPTLAVQWTFTVPAADTVAGADAGFRASPVEYNGRVFIGSGNGRMYALDANTGAVLWRFPAPPTAPLRSQFMCNPSSQGIASSAAIARIGNTDAIIFGAPDTSFGTGFGEGRLFALNAATGAIIWKSPVVAQLTGTTSGSTTELHQQIGYSSPVVYGDRVYVGVGDHCDNPIQKGRIIAVMLNNGAIDPAFTYCSTGACGDATRGGGVWSGVAVWADGVYATTGNTKRMGTPEPSPNNGLSMLRLNRTTGAVVWRFQPVPFTLDDDPDWSSGPNLVSASCGLISVSTMKDGWTHAVDTATGARRWTFPTATIPFHLGDGTMHGDTRFMRAGAAWGDVFITMAGGLTTTTDLSAGYRRLHALNVCANDTDRIRWIVDVPNASGGAYSLGAPTVSRGIVYIGTDQGHLVAIADPSVAPAAGWRCSNVDVPTASCVASGYSLVPQPAVLANVTLSGSMVYNEAAIAGGRLFVATGGGRVYMLKP
jgi:outer membrane protein assembly factor BamB